MFENIIIKTNQIIRKGWLKSIYNGSGGMGITLEKLLDVETNTLEIPDFNEIEIKTKKINTNGYISLFSATPDSFLFEIRRIHQYYGYPDRINKNFKVFNMSFTANDKVYIGKNLYGTLKIDNTEHKVVLVILDKHGNIIDSNCSWSFELLAQKINRKLKTLFLVHGQQKVLDNQIYFKYLDYSCYVIKGFNHFINCLENGYIRVSFKIGLIRSGPKTGQICNHGTSFDIKESQIEALYNKIRC
ncbi:MAG: MvaI/BcnI restriction endonuclease family protein [Firmicutes bacterium]|nr:MvaI/BcnI restriction endonuclease family protein [Bacillota bacterium]